MLTLVRLTGPRKNEKLQFDQARVRLGRAKTNHVRFDRSRERVVSNYHAEIRAESGGYVLYDLQSTHGTYVNNERISRRRLQEGDIVGLALQMGGPSFRFSQRAPERLLSELQARQEISHTGAASSAKETGRDPDATAAAPGDAVVAARSSERSAADGLEVSHSGDAGGSQHWAEPEMPTSWSALPSDAARSGAASSSGVPESGAPWAPGGEGGEEVLQALTAGASPSAAASSDGLDFDGETTSACPPPALPPAPSPVSHSKVGSAVAEGRRLLTDAKARVRPWLQRFRPGRGSSPAPAPGALLEPNAGSVSLGTRIGAAWRGAGRVVRMAGRRVFPKGTRPAVGSKQERKKSKKAARKRGESASGAPSLEAAPGSGRPRLTRPFVLEEAIKEKPRADWIWMQEHRWLLRFLLVAIALSWWYKDDIFGRLHQYYGEPVPMIQGRAPEAPLVDPPGSRNPVFVALARERFDATQGRPLPHRSDGNRDLRALRPVLWKAGEESGLVPVDFLDDISEVIGEVRGEQDFAIVYARSTKYRPRLVAMLRECHLPEIMSFIPWVESGYLPSFEDNQTGRVGLWGLDVETARRHGLTVNSRRDERRDWELSTRAACSYLVELVGELRGLSFTLAVAAYREGPRGVRRMLAQRHAWKRDQINLWYLYREDDIPSEMFDYLARVLAVASIAGTPEAYHLPPIEDD